MTSKPHNLIAASRVRGAVVYNASGDSIGHVHDLSIDKASGQVRYALISFGGVLGLGERFHPMPWSLLHYDVAMDGYIVPLDASEVEAAPSYSHEELAAFGADAGGLVARMVEHYAARKDASRKDASRKGPRAQAR